MEPQSSITAISIATAFDKHINAYYKNKLHVVNDLYGQGFVRLYSPLHTVACYNIIVVPNMDVLYASPFNVYIRRHTTTDTGDLLALCKEKKILILIVNLGFGFLDESARTFVDLYSRHSTAYLCCISQLGIKYNVNKLLFTDLYNRSVVENFFNKL